jgi:hypothetical protein
MKVPYFLLLVKSTNKTHRSCKAKENGPMYLIPAKPSPENSTAIMKRPIPIVMAAKFALRIQIAQHKNLGFSSFSATFYAEISVGATSSI